MGTVEYDRSLLLVLKKKNCRWESRADLRFIDLLPPMTEGSS